MYKITIYIITHYRYYFPDYFLQKNKDMRKLKIDDPTLRSNPCFVVGIPVFLANPCLAPEIPTARFQEKEKP